MNSKTHSKVKILNQLENLELSCVISNNQQHHDIYNHYHDGISFAIITNGIGEFYFKNEPIKVKKGAIIKIASGETHTSGLSIGISPLKYKVFYVPKKLMETTVENNFHEKIDTINFKEKVTYDNSFYASFLEIHNDLFQNKYILHQKSLFDSLMISLMNKFTTKDLILQEKTIEPFYLKKIINYLATNFREQISLNDLSEISNRSSSQIIRSFKKHIGISPHSYLLNLRIIEAKKLLSKGSSISQVALELGFTDQSHLHRYFKRFNHITPYNFKNSNV
jgi:AraC-like DNA-binding protein/mannose-6-phosphate isomerase-like protein (cupin superfamily)